MGALSSLPTIQPAGDKDILLKFPDIDKDQFLARCEEEISHLPKPLERSFCKQNKETQVKEDSIRVLSWNILSQGRKCNHKSKAIQFFTFSALGTQNDGFV